MTDIPTAVTMTSIRPHSRCRDSDKAEDLSGLTAFLDELERWPFSDDIR